MPLVDPVTMLAPTTDHGMPKGSTLPVAILGSQFATVIRILQPTLLCALFLSTFRRLVADPVQTMCTTLLATIIIQTTYIVTCLPPAGSNVKPKKARPSARKEPERAPNVFVTAALALVLSLLVTPALHAALVLFGAPFLNNILHTLLLSAHVSLLGIFPLLYVHSADTHAWRSVAACTASVDEVFGGLVGAVAGTWLGAVPIPLDWDRDWQRWPVTVLSGLWIGYVLGKTVGGTLGFRVKFGTFREDSGMKRE